MVTSVFDETGAKMISATRRIFYMQNLQINKKSKKNEKTTDSGVNIRIGMTAAQNDERGDQGLARTVDKIRKKTDFVLLSKIGF